MHTKEISREAKNMKEDYIFSQKHLSFLEKLLKTLFFIHILLNNYKIKTIKIIFLMKILINQ